MTDNLKIYFTEVSELPRPFAELKTLRVSPFSAHARGGQEAGSEVVLHTYKQITLNTIHDEKYVRLT